MQQKAEIVDFNQKNLENYVTDEIINIQNINKYILLENATNALCKGKTILLLVKTSTVLSFNTEGWTERNVSTPNVERTIRGPQEAFMENIKVNLGLVRRRIKSNNFKVANFNKGKHSQTRISVMWLKGIADENIVEEVKKRIESIEVAQVIGCENLAELIEDNPLTFFNTIFQSERPDVVANGILEGRVGILVNGCPTCLLVPKLFMENFISPKDYYNRFPVTLVLRGLRLSAYIISTLLPAVYISIINFQPELIPTTLAYTIHASRKEIPLPITIELLFFLFFFQMIKESGSMAPSSLSTSISIIGTVLLGQTAITSGFLSSDGVIIGSLTGISIFLLPSIELSNALIYIRFITIIAAGLMGFLGLTVVVLVLFAHLASLRSFGVPFLSPVAPLQLQDLKDFFMRVPYIFMKTRPESIESEDQIRQGNKPVKRYFFKYKIKKDDS